MGFTLARPNYCMLVPNTAQPTNLTTNQDKSHLSWSGTRCGAAITYEINITQVSGVLTMMVYNVTSKTSTTLCNLEPNQMYTVSVRAIGSSCSTQPTKINFMTPAFITTTTIAGNFVGKLMCFISWSFL